MSATSSGNAWRVRLCCWTVSYSVAARENHAAGGEGVFGHWRQGGGWHLRVGELWFEVFLFGQIPPPLSGYAGGVGEGNGAGAGDFRNEGQVLAREAQLHPFGLAGGVAGGCP